ncbi:MAG: methanogenesis marker 16 metalloprotein [Candidatus Nezhaarchaeales archaeon]
MSDRLRSIKEINEKIRKGEAVVLTAKELCDMVRRGEEVRNVDVVTSATCGVMSGTMAVLSFKVAEKGAFTKAKSVLMNGVPAFPGPCPNERLGIVDVILYGTSTSIYNPTRYGGGALIRDLIEGKKVEVRVESIEGKVIESDITLQEMTYAKMITTRSCFRNYMAFVNPQEKPVKSIFSILEMEGNLKAASVSGCGEVNPLEKDPLLKTIGVGTKVLVNKAYGYVIGPGTRATKERPNLSISADIKGMSSYYMGQFITSLGPEPFNTIAAAIPVIDEEVLKGVKRIDEEVQLPIADVNNREVIGFDNYAKVWQGTDLEVSYNKGVCETCRVSPCPVALYCPTEAFRGKGDLAKHKCFECGACTWLCPQGAFKAKLGSIRLGDVEVPVKLRQSCRRRAETLSEYLKRLIEDREFYLSEPSDKIVI